MYRRILTYYFICLIQAAQIDSLQTQINDLKSKVCTAAIDVSCVHGTSSIRMRTAVFACLSAMGLPNSSSYNSSTCHIISPTQAAQVDSLQTQIKNLTTKVRVSVCNDVAVHQGVFLLFPCLSVYLGLPDSNSHPSVAFVPFVGHLPRVYPIISPTQAAQVDSLQTQIRDLTAKVCRAINRRWLAAPR